MYVLIDLEWVSNERGQNSFSQIALARVDNNWEPVDKFYSRIRPIDVSFYNWTHMGFTGGTPSEFLASRKAAAVMDDVARWLQPSDILVWWEPNARDMLYRFDPDIKRSDVILRNYVYRFLAGQPESIGNAYHIGKARGIAAPGLIHESQSDIEMIRLLMKKIKFPQEILTNPKLGQTIPRQSNANSDVFSLPYILDLCTNTVHRNGCEHLSAYAPVKAYKTLKPLITSGVMPCQCLVSEFRQAQRERIQDIIDRSEYSFIFSPDSNVFHKRNCKLMLNAKNVSGTVRYNFYGSSSRRPCKVCNPSPKDATYRFVRSPNSACNNHGLTKQEQKAVNRHRQAQEERRSYERRGALAQNGKEDLYTLTQPRFAFWAASGYKTFHLRNCKKMSGLSNLEGFSRYEDAVCAGYRPCKCCKPNKKHNIAVSFPIYSRKREGDSVKDLVAVCAQNAYRYTEKENRFILETPVGIWRIDISCAPYRLEHINLAMTPQNRSDFHYQPRIFYSLRDTITYINRHDNSIIKTLKKGQFNQIHRV